LIIRIRYYAQQVGIGHCLPWRDNKVTKEERFVAGATGRPRHRRGTPSWCHGFCQREKKVITALSCIASRVQKHAPPSASWRSNCTLFVHSSEGEWPHELPLLPAGKRCRFRRTLGCISNEDRLHIK
jgi:hypothetical protein